MGHASDWDKGQRSEVGDVYSKLKEDVEFRKEVAERIGLGFSCTECTEISNQQEAVGVTANSR
jgi:hypothetical protein